MHHRPSRQGLLLFVSCLLFPSVAMAVQATFVEGPFENVVVERDGTQVLAVNFTVLDASVTVGPDCSINSPTGEAMALEDFAALAESQPLAGFAEGVVEAGVLVAQAVGLFESAGESVEGPFDNVLLDRDGEMVLAVTFTVLDTHVQVDPDTVIQGPEGELMPLQEFAALAESQPLAGLVEGTVEDGILIAGELQIFEMPGPEVHGRLSAWSPTADGAILETAIHFSEETVQVVVLAETRIYTQEPEEPPVLITLPELLALCDGGLALEVHAAGELLENPETGVQLLALEVTLQTVFAGAQGMFQGGEIDLAADRILLDLEGVPLLVTAESWIELDHTQVLSLGSFAQLVEQAVPFGALAEGVELQDGGIMAMKLFLESEANGEKEHLEGQLKSCEAGTDSVSMVIQGATSILQAKADGATQLELRDGEENVTPLDLAQLLELCAEDQLFSIEGERAGDQSPFLFQHARFRRFEAEIEGHFQGGQVTEDPPEIRIVLAGTAVRIDANTEIFGLDDQPMTYEELASLVNGGAEHRAAADGGLWRDGSIAADPLALMQPENVRILQPHQGDIVLAGTGYPGIAFEIQDDRRRAAIVRGTVGADGKFRLSLTSPLVRGQRLTPVALGIRGTSVRVSGVSVPALGSLGIAFMGLVALAFGLLLTRRERLVWSPR